MRHLSSGGPTLKLVFIATYPPRRCGIATFTRDLRSAVGSGDVVAVQAPDQPYIFPMEVRSRIRRDHVDDYRHAALAIASLGADVVSLQHEYGIYGGADGEHVLELVHRLTVPVIATLHTVLERPSPSQQQILRELADGVDALVVMSQAAAGLLTSMYGIDPALVEIIPHGVPGPPSQSRDELRARLGMDERPTALSFGLLGPGKGYEAAIEAMRDVADRIPDARYVVIGATHPDLVRREGESYRRSLEARVRDLRLERNVDLVDRFVGSQELRAWLAAADVFVSPYPGLQQIVSGTLSYALGMGLPIVSTPYAYARELLANGRGLLVAPQDPGALGRAIGDLLVDPIERARLAERALAHGRTMRWPRVGAAYRRLFASLAIAPASRPALVSDFSHA